MSGLEELILSTLSSGNEIADSWTFAEQHQQPHQAIVGAIKSLLVDAYVVDEPITSTFWVLTEEGSEIVAKGSPEYQVFQAIPADGGISVTELNKLCGDVAKIGLGPCMKSKWLKKDGENILRIATSVVDETAGMLAKVEKGDLTGVSEDDLKNWKRRKLINQVVRKSFKITKGPDFQPQRTRKLAELTKEMLGNANEMAPGIFNSHTLLHTPYSSFSHEFHHFLNFISACCGWDFVSVSVSDINQVHIGLH